MDVPQHAGDAVDVSRAAKAMLFVRALNYYHGKRVSRSTPMLGDNKALYDQLQQDGASARTRYYERAMLLLKRTVLLFVLFPSL